MGVLRHATYECDRCKHREDADAKARPKYGALAMFGKWRWRKIGFTTWPVFDMNPFIERMLCGACYEQLKAFMSGRALSPNPDGEG